MFKIKLKFVSELKLNMKLKFPKKIEILSYQFKIVYNKNESGGYFNFDQREIGIGTKRLELNPDYVFMIICHEIMEMITVMTNTRYDDGSVAGDWKFFMSHKEFENNIQIFSKAIKEFIV